MYDIIETVLNLQETQNQNMKHKFIGKVELSPGNIVDVEAFVESDALDNLMYDEVFDAISDEMDKKYPEEYYPRASISEIFIEDEGNLYPVVDDEAKTARYNNSCEKVLVLPCYRYSLTDEAKLYQLLKDNHIIDEVAEFDAASYRNVINGIDEHRKACNA